LFCCELFKEEFHCIQFSRVPPLAMANRSRSEDTDSEPSLPSTVDMTLEPQHRAVAEYCACLKNIDYAKHQMKHVETTIERFENDRAANIDKIKLLEETLSKHVPDDLVEEIIKYTDCKDKECELKELLKKFNKYQKEWIQMLDEAKANFEHWKKIVSDMENGSCNENNNICD